MAKSAASKTSKTSKASKTNLLAASLRTETGKGASRRARRAGKVPAVIYGHGTESRHLELDAHDYAAVLRKSGTNAILALDIDGTEQLALTKALHIHPIRRTIQHADLVVVRRGEKVVVEIYVVIEGDAAPGTLVTQETNSVDIEAEAMSIPEELTVSIEGAEAGTQYTAGELTLPEGVTLISDPELLVVNVVMAPTAEEMEGEAAEEAGEAEAAAEAGAAQDESESE